MDYPDSPPEAGDVMVPADASILDTEDGSYQQDVIGQQGGIGQQDNDTGSSGTQMPQPTAGKRCIYYINIKPTPAF
jgi:hypothetical protein